MRNGATESRHSKDSIKRKDETSRCPYIIAIVGQNLAHNKDYERNRKEKTKENDYTWRKTSERQPRKKINTGVLLKCGNAGHKINPKCKKWRRCKKAVGRSSQSERADGPWHGFSQSYPAEIIIC